MEKEPSLSYEWFHDRNNRLSEWRKLFEAANVRSDVDVMLLAKLHLDFYASKNERERKQTQFEIVSYWLNKLRYRPRAEQLAGIQTIGEEGAEAWKGTVDEMLAHVSAPVPTVEETDVQS